MEWPIIESILPSCLDIKIAEAPICIHSESHRGITVLLPTDIAPILGLKRKRTCRQSSQSAIHHGIVLTSVVGLPAQEASADSNAKCHNISKRKTAAKCCIKKISWTVIISGIFIPVTRC